jgi:hypothetical protein
MKPPMQPNVISRSPSLSVTSPGMMVWYGRLRGPRTLGLEGSRVKLWQRFWRVNPQPCKHVQSGVSSVAAAADTQHPCAC